MDGVAILIEEIYEKDNIRQDIKVGEKRDEILVTEKSVTRAEWTIAGKNGLNASCVLITPLINYDGQIQIEYEGKRYMVYRTYKDGDCIELYLGERVGV